MVEYIIIFIKNDRLFSIASTEQPDVLLSSHILRWNNIRSNGHIDIEGNDELQRQINSAYYYILSSLPPSNDKTMWLKYLFIVFTINFNCIIVIIMMGNKTLVKIIVKSS
jgi:hypothetical protein